jgi:hypothetical protein
MLTLETFKRKLKEEKLSRRKVAKALGWELAPETAIKHYVNLNNHLSYNEALSQIKEMMEKEHVST